MHGKAGSSDGKAVSLPEQWFHTMPPGHFALGYVFRFDEGNVVDAGVLLADDRIGQWACDIEHGDRLTWSDRVYELFDMPVGAPIPREQAVERYSDRSRTILERLRAFAILNQCGFLLDATMTTNAPGADWIRIMALPAVKDGEVVGLHGLKRAL